MRPTTCTPAIRFHPLSAAGGAPVHDGSFVGPFVYGFDFKLNLEHLKREYTVDLEEVQPLRFFGRGDAVQVLGLIPWTPLVAPARRHALLLGRSPPGTMFSRITHGARVSLTVGLFGITVSFLGILWDAFFLGNVSGLRLTSAVLLFLG